MDITNLLLVNHISDNSFQAAHIANGLKLWELKTDEERIERCRLYRAWRPKTDRKNQVPTWQAYQLAIAGIDPADVEPRQVDMFAEVG